MGNDQTPSGSLSDFDIAGYGTDDGSTWYINEGESHSSSPDFPIKEFDEERDIDWVDSVTVRFTDEDGNDHWYTLHGPWDDYEELEREIEDLWAEYGGEAA